MKLLCFDIYKMKLQDLLCPNDIFYLKSDLNKKEAKFNLENEEYI